MKTSIYDILKARFLVNEDAVKNWRFLVFLIVLAMIMIANIHWYEKKIFEILALNKEVKELRSEFVDRRSELMKLKMESTVAKKMESRNILPSEVPPVKIVVESKENKNSFWDKLKIWQ